MDTSTPRAKAYYVYTDKENQETKKPKTLKKVLGRFAESTSISGLPHLHNAKTKVGRVFWGALVIVGFLAMFVHLYFLFAEFLSWPKKTTISLGFNNLQLPAITLCNVNAVRKSRLEYASDRLVSFTNKINPANLLGTISPDDLDLETYDYDYGVEWSGDDEYNYNYDEYNDENAMENGFYQRDKISEISTNFRGLYLNESRSNRILMGHDFNKTLNNCAFNGYKCYSENFTLYQTPKYGNCYTLDLNSFVVKRPGPSAGLFLTLYLETFEYLPGVTDGYGIRVTLHAPNTVPFPEESGSFLPGGQESSIALKQTKISRIGYPYGTCATDDEFKTLYNRTYNRQSCLYLCKTTLTLKTCGCFDPLNAEVLVSAATSKKECVSQSELKCMIKIAIQLNKKTISCDCPDPCSENTYSQHLTSRQWPTDDYAIYLRKSVCDRFPNDNDCNEQETMSDENLRRNFLKLSVYYADLNFQSISEEPDIANAQFASDFGGAIGLWIGLSVLSMFELVYLCGMIGGYFMNKSSKKQPKDKRRRYRSRPYQDWEKSFSLSYSTSANSGHSNNDRDWAMDSVNDSPFCAPYPYSDVTKNDSSRSRIYRYAADDSVIHRKQHPLSNEYQTNGAYQYRRW
ncbi:degenerin unc-8-like [Pecten maximus]|uniref:degenerin unc-8-like n=1 Tax=Pecten maximus TaxID=6579 RepID=UPI0014588040|nr:degenerin unc-8-like [Pecten maximus]